MPYAGDFVGRRVIIAAGFEVTAGSLAQGLSHPGSLLWGGSTKASEQLALAIERRTLLDTGYDLDRVLSTDDLVGGQDVFVAATGVTNGALLKGVRYETAGAVTESIVMRSRSGTVRRVEARHAFEKLMKFSSIAYR